MAVRKSDNAEGAVSAMVSRDYRSENVNSQAKNNRRGRACLSAAGGEVIEVPFACLAMSRFEIFHEAHEGAYALVGHGIVKAGPEAADRAMPLKVDQPKLPCFFKKE